NSETNSFSHHRYFVGENRHRGGKKFSKSLFVYWKKQSTKTPAKRRMPVVITAPYRECRAKVLCDSWWKSNSRNCRFAWVATWATQRVTAGTKPQGQKSMNDRLATVRAATRVKPEQASKAVTRGSSRPDNGEDQWCSCQRTEAHGHARRGIG